MTAKPRLACLAALVLLGACGGSPPPPAPPPAPPHERTVFDDLVDKKTTVPAAVDSAQREHLAATQRALDEAEGPPAEAAPR